MPKAKIELPVQPKPMGEVPHLFGRGMRDRLLVLLAINDRQLYVMEMARALNSDLTQGPQDRLKFVGNVLVCIGERGRRGGR